MTGDPPTTTGLRALEPLGVPSGTTRAKLLVRARRNPLRNGRTMTRTKELCNRCAGLCRSVREQGGGIYGELRRNCQCLVYWYGTTQKGATLLPGKNTRARASLLHAREKSHP